MLRRFPAVTQRRIFARTPLLSGARKELKMPWMIALMLAQDPPAFHVLLHGKPRMAVIDALSMADRLLDAPPCHAMFVEFRDPMGRSLATNLEAARETPRERLARLYFSDADARQCRANPRMIAYTEPGSRVIWICGDRFADEFAMAVRPGAFRLIHELLHSAGLGENPPTSAEITDAVATRCGKGR
jgi:hypothetical protein